MSCSRTHAFGTDVGAIAMSPAVLPSGSGLRRWIASSRRRSASAAANFSPVVVVIVPFFLLRLLLSEFWEIIRDIISYICVSICCSRVCRSCSRRYMLLAMAENWPVRTDWSDVGVTGSCADRGVLIVLTGAV